LQNLESETESVVRGILDAFQASLVDPVLLEGGGVDGKDVIVEQEEKIIDKEGNVKVKERTLHNPTREEIDTKTLEELETDEGDDVTTMQTIRLRLSDNDLSDHAFSNFGLAEPKAAASVRAPQNNLISDFAFYTIKLGVVFLAGAIIYGGYRAYMRKGRKMKRRYHQKEDEEQDSDDEEMSNIDNKNAKSGYNFLSEDKID
jgi:hypothetical protein